jgi:hypothetical protein
MKFLKTLFHKTPRDQTVERENVAGTLPAIDLTRKTRPVTSTGNGEKQPRVSNLTLMMLLSDM